MSKFFEDYVWKNGKPYGTTKKLLPKNEITYRVIADPYYKRISIEKYFDKLFDSVVYDSALFDFRHLKPAEQNAWQKVFVSQAENKTICHIRNQDDRLVLVEEYTFENNLCRECHSYSPHGILVSSQKIYYKTLNDQINGATLFDRNNHPVMYKTYQVNPATNEFSELIFEQWDMRIEA
ncbi:MAG: hypothetical protein H0X29_06200 [Parachlamydiaceae bacterium]|nr:hypothetical protein [Parachlamydiaceae bacterium]